MAATKWSDSAVEVLLEFSLQALERIDAILFEGIESLRVVRPLVLVQSNDIGNGEREAAHFHASIQAMQGADRVDDRHADALLDQGADSRGRGHFHPEMAGDSVIPEDVIQIAPIHVLGREIDEADAFEIAQPEPWNATSAMTSPSSFT